MLIFDIFALDTQMTEKQSKREIVDRKMASAVNAASRLYLNVYVGNLREKW